MIKRKISVVLAVIAALVIPFSAFAATSDATVAKNVRGFFGIDASKLTDVQKADVKDFTEKMAELQKGFVNKMVDNGALTKEQAEAEIERIEDMLANGQKKPFMFGMGMGKSSFRGKGFGKDFMMKEIDTSKLTDTQKTDLIESFRKQIELQKAFFNKMISYGVLTPEQGASSIEKTDALLKAIEENDISKCLKMAIGGFGSFNCLNIRRLDTSKLTEEQKADFTEFSNKATQLRNETVDKMVTFGLITSDQGNSIKEKIGPIEDTGKMCVPSKGKRMFKEKGGKWNKQGEPNSSTNATPAT